MFTGIVQHVGVVAEASHSGQASALSLDLGALAEETAVGDSVCVSGVCLTAAEASAPLVRFDVGAETLRRTTLGGLRRGDHVNVELALRVGDRLGGHFVQGHVDGVGAVAERREPAGEVRVAVAVPGCDALSHIDEAYEAVIGFQPLSAEAQAELIAKAGEHKGRDSEWYKRPADD